ncbi:MAG: MFS transporter [Pseudomonadales bacterium]
MGEARIYYGWWLVAALFVVLAVSSGFGFYNMSVYMNVLAREHGHGIGELSLAVSLFFLVGGVGGMWVANLLERFDARIVMASGGLLAGIALACSGAVTSLPGIYALFSLFGFGNAAVSIVTSTTLVTRWFPGRDRSVALSVASTGLSAGGILLTPWSARVLETQGPETALGWFGIAFAAVIVPLSLLVVRDRPKGLAPGAATHGNRARWDYGVAIRTRFFVLLTLGYLFAMGAQVGGIAHLYNRAVGLAGIDTATLAVQALTLCSITGRFAGGFLVTRVSIRLYTLTNLLGQGLGLALIAGAESASLVLGGAVVFGLTVGNLLMLHPLWLAEGFGVESYARIFSLSNAVTVIGVAGGPALLGGIFDVGGYPLAYLVAAASSALAFVALLAAGSAPRRTE